MHINETGYKRESSVDSWYAVRKHIFVFVEICVKLVVHILCLMYVQYNMKYVMLCNIGSKKLASMPAGGAAATASTTATTSAAPAAGLMSLYLRT